MKKTMKRLFSIALVLSVLAALVACGGGTSSSSAGSAAPDSSGSAFSEPVVKDTLRVALQRNITDLSGSSGGNATYGVVYSIFDTLARFNADTMELEPCLATSWEQADDYTWRFVLREGVTFTNGEVFNAESAAYAINYLADPEFNYQNYKQWGISWPPSASVESEYVLLVTTDVPNLSVPKLLTRFAMIPMEASKDEAFWTAPIGTGPYKLATWEPGVRVTLDANENYWNGKPSIEHQIYDIVTDGTARAALIESGEYDFVQDVPVNYAVEKMSEDSTMELIKTEQTGSWVLYFNGNSDNKFIQDPSFRYALTYAIDHQLICDTLLNGIVDSPEGIAPMNITGAYDGGGFPERDVEKAKQLAAACGYNGEEIVYAYSSSQFNNDLEVIELIITELQEAGFNVRFEEIDSSTWSKYRKTGEYDIAANNFGGTYIGDSEQNYTQGVKGVYWIFDEAEAILEKIYSEGITEDARVTYLEELMKICWEKTPYLWMSTSCGMWAANPDLKGFEIFANGQTSFNNAYFG